MRSQVVTGRIRFAQPPQDDFEAVLARSRAFGVEKIIVTGVDLSVQTLCGIQECTLSVHYANPPGGSLSESQAALTLARATASSASLPPLPALFSTVGVHPTRCGEFEENDENLDAAAYFARLVAICEDGASDGKVVAIGECGLDYDRLEFCDKETQLKYFEKQFELAERTRLPMFLHNRNTDGDFYGKSARLVRRHTLSLERERDTCADLGLYAPAAMIAKNRSRFSNGVVHSFTGSTEEALKLVDLGLYIGASVLHIAEQVTRERKWLTECARLDPYSMAQVSMAALSRHKKTSRRCGRFRLSV